MFADGFRRIQVENIIQYRYFTILNQRRFCHMHVTRLNNSHDIYNTFVIRDEHIFKNVGVAKFGYNTNHLVYYVHLFARMTVPFMIRMKSFVYRSVFSYSLLYMR